MAQSGGFLNEPDTGRTSPDADLLGIGFGPANLALAVAASRTRPQPRTCFLEARPGFAWHPGMMLPDAMVQNSFLKDLISMRDPRSEFSFLSYLAAHGRAHNFVNLERDRPTRWEFDDYFRWVAARFASAVSYGSRVERVRPVPDPDGVVRSLAVVAVDGEGRRTERTTRHVVLAPGGRPRRLERLVPAGPRVVHSSEYLDRIGALLGERPGSTEVAVVGAGQSGAEIVAHLAARPAVRTVHWLVAGAAPRPADDNPFVNDIFTVDEVDRHYAEATGSGPTGHHDELRNSNYGVADRDLLVRLYGMEYDGRIRGDARIRVHTRTRLAGARELPDGRLRVTTDPGELTVDALVLATGYHREPLPEVAAELLPLLAEDPDGRPRAERGYRLRTRPGVEAGIFVQGLAEPSHGLGDTLFPVMPHRAAAIAEQVADDLRRTGRHRYPPLRHLERRQDVLVETMIRYPLATLLTAYEGQVDATTIPMILHTDTGPHGELFGHLDADNPQVAHLDGRPFLAVFQGPNAYITPHVFTSDQLPTWNYLTVQVRGVARRLRDPEELVDGLLSIPPYADHRADAYRLRRDDPRIAAYLAGIVGFRFEVTEVLGRFKTSQDRDDADRVRAGEELASQAALAQADFLRRVFAPGPATAPAVRDGSSP